MKRGKRYAQARKTLGLSQDELAQIIQITQTSISKMERDKFEKPNHEYTDYLVSQGFNRIWLVDGEGEMKTQINTESFKTKGIKEIDNPQILLEEFEKLKIEVKEKDKTIERLTNKVDTLSGQLIEALQKIQSLYEGLKLEKHKAYTMQPLINSAVYARP